MSSNNSKYSSENLTYTKNTEPILSLRGEIPFSDYNINTKLKDGSTISIVLSKSSYHAIYRTVGSHKIEYEYSIPTQEIHEQLVVLLAEILRAEDKFKGTADNDIMNRAIPIFNTIYSNSPQKAENLINDLQDYISNRAPVKQIIGSDKDFIVWLDSDNTPNFISWKNTDHLNTTLAEYFRLRALGKSFLNGSLRENFSNQLGAALVATFKNDKNGVSLFRNLDQLVSKLVDNSLRSKYTLSTAITTILLSIAGAAVIYSTQNQQIHMGSWSVIGGVIGAFISIQRRLKEITCKISDPINTIVIQALIRIIIGGIFGFIAFISTQIGIAFDIFKSNILFMVLLGAAAGFSEQLIPDLLKSIDRNGNSPAN